MRIAVIVPPSRELETDALGGFEVVSSLKEAEGAEGVAGFPGDLVNLKPWEGLRWVHSFSAGVDRVLTPKLVNSDIVVSNSSGVHAVPMAEYVVAALLAVAKGFPLAFANQKNKAWERLGGISELRGATVLIVGLGSIGREAARLCSCLGMRVRAVDADTTEPPSFVEGVSGPERLLEAVGEADAVVSTLPLTPQTRGLFDKALFSAMKRTAVFVNVGRGGTVKEQDLVSALKNREIAGAVLDVTETEPLLPDSPLWELQNVLVTPHQSASSPRSWERTVEVFLKNADAYLARDPLPNEVDKQKGY